MEINHSTEKLSLLIAYLSCIGVWFAIPSVSLIINRDDRWPIALTILLIIFNDSSSITSWSLFEFT